MPTTNYNLNLLIKNGKIRSMDPKDEGIVGKLLRPAAYAWLRDKIKDSPETHADVIVNIKCRTGKDSLKLDFKIKQVNHVAAADTVNG